MISIRANLLCSLLPAFACISLLAGFGIYYSTRAELVARLDAELAGIAVDLRFMTPAERDAIRGKPRFNKRPGQNARLNPLRTAGGIAQMQDSLFTNLPENVYCEIWLGNRQLTLKTENLDGEKIIRPESFEEDPVFYNAALQDGLQLRAWAARLPVLRDKQSQKVILAIDRSDTDQTLRHLAQELVGGGLAACLFLSLLLIVVLRISLRPLRNLGEQAATMDAESLDQRFPAEKAPADIRPIVERLNNLMAKLEESFSRERRFSGDLAHELRTPLAAIRTTSEVAIKWPEQSSAEDFEEIYRIASNLQQTLDSLLLLARMESATAEQKMETVSPATLAEECTALHTARAEERGIKLSTDPEQQDQIKTDPQMLRIIMTNLIGNAVEYAPAGSAICIKTGAAGTIFQCLNSAPDLLPEDIVHLFERMWRKDGARTESGHAGLGLSIAKACADALNLNLQTTLNDEGLLSISLCS